MLEGPSTPWTHNHTDAIFEQDGGEDMLPFFSGKLGDLGVEVLGHGEPLVMHLQVKQSWYVLHEIGVLDSSIFEVLSECAIVLLADSVHFFQELVREEACDSLLVLQVFGFLRGSGPPCLLQHQRQGERLIALELGQIVSFEVGGGDVPHLRSALIKEANLLGTQDGL